MKGYPTAPFTYGRATLSGVTKIVLANPQRSGCLFINMSSIDIYFGDADVTTATGLLLLGTKGAGISIPTTGEIWAVAASGTPQVSWMDIYHFMRTTL